MSTDLSGPAKNAPKSPEERPDQPPSDAGASRPAPALAEEPAPQDADSYQNIATTDELSATPAESEQPVPLGNGVDYSDNAAAGGNPAVAAPEGGANSADPSQQMAAQANPPPTGGSTEQAGGAAGQSFIGDASSYARRWESIQVGFVDDPRAAVHEAETLVSDVMGEVIATFQQQRQQLEAQWSGGGQASTDDLRGAFQRYRDFFHRLLQI